MLPATTTTAAIVRPIPNGYCDDACDESVLVLTLALTFKSVVSDNVFVVRDEAMLLVIFLTVVVLATVVVTSAVGVIVDVFVVVASHGDPVKSVEKKGYSPYYG